MMDYPVGHYGLTQGGTTFCFKCHKLWPCQPAFDWMHARAHAEGAGADRPAITLEERDRAITSVMDRYHHVGPDHVPDDDPVGECPECADIVGMLLTVERYAVQQWRAGK